MAVTASRTVSYMRHRRGLVQATESLKEEAQMSTGGMYLLPMLRRWKVLSAPVSSNLTKLEICLLRQYNDQHGSKWIERQFKDKMIFLYSP
jgi:hypothetical protein